MDSKNEQPGEELPDDFRLEPPRGEQWCTVCATLIRGEANNLVKARPGEMTDDEAVAAAIESGKWPLRLAVAMMVPVIIGPPPFGSGLVMMLSPCCWEHGLGVSVGPNKAVVPANPAEAAMFGQKVPQIGTKRAG